MDCQEGRWSTLIWTQNISFCRTVYNGLLTAILHTSLPPESANSTRRNCVSFASSHCIFVEHEPGGSVLTLKKICWMNEWINSARSNHLWLLIKNLYLKFFTMSAWPVCQPFLLLFFPSVLKYLCSWNDDYNLSSKSGHFEDEMGHQDNTCTLERYQLTQARWPPSLLVTL